METMQILFGEYIKFKLKNLLISTKSSKYSKSTILISLKNFLKNRKKNDVKVQEIKEIKDRVKIHEKEGKFVIEKAHEDDKGNYSCSLPDGSVKSFDVWGKFFTDFLVLNLIIFSSFL